MKVQNENENEIYELNYIFYRKYWIIEWILDNYVKMKLLNITITSLKLNKTE